MVLSSMDFTAFGIFITCWIGYTNFSRIKARNTPCISMCLHQHRIHWMRHLLSHEIRVSDAALLANLERNIAFFASTTLLVLAGIFALFSQVTELHKIIDSFAFAQEPNDLAIQLKLCLLALIFVWAFFQFTWSMRQYNFVNVMVGAAPVASSVVSKHLIAYAQQMATMQDQAGHAYNYGLRAYYFALAALCWFFHPAIFIFASLLVVYILYRREFKSKAVQAIKNGQYLLEAYEQEAGANQEVKL